MRVLGQRGALDHGADVTLARRLMDRRGGDRGASQRRFDAGIRGREPHELGARGGEELRAPTLPRPKPRSV